MKTLTRRIRSAAGTLAFVVVYYPLVAMSARAALTRRRTPLVEAQRADIADEAGNPWVWRVGNRGEGYYLNGTNSVGPLTLHEIALRYGLRDAD